MAVDPYDEPGIKNDDTVIRRVSQYHIVPDKNGAEPRLRLSSAAFNKSEGPRAGMSVDLEKLMVDDGVDPREFVITPVFTGAVSFSAGSARDLDLIIGYEPVKDDPNQPDNPYHGEVWRKEEAKKFTNSQTKGLQRSAEWYVPLDGVDVR